MQSVAGRRACNKGKTKRDGVRCGTGGKVSMCSLEVRKKRVNVLTVETGQGSSETATQEAAAVDYGSAACGREDI